MWNETTAMQRLGVEFEPFDEDPTHYNQSQSEQVLSGNLQGYSGFKGDQAILALRGNLEPEKRLYVLVHELAHHVLGHTKIGRDIQARRAVGITKQNLPLMLNMIQWELDEPTREVEAESVVLELASKLKLPDAAIQNAMRSAFDAKECIGKCSSQTVLMALSVRLLHGPNALDGTDPRQPDMQAVKQAAETIWQAGQLAN